MQSYMTRGMDAVAVIINVSIQPLAVRAKN